jgi:hypothetical protein
LEYVLSLHTEPNHFEIKTKGKAEVSGFSSFLTEIFTHSEWVPGSSVLLDHSELILRSFNTDEVRSVSRFVLNNTDKIGSGKWAFVISSNFAYGMARMWQIITEEKAPMEINIFKNREKALEWLMSKDMDESIKGESKNE